MTPEPSLWMRKVAEDPGHSGWYVERFRRLRLDGVDISGEARTVDAMLERGSLVLDAGCGGGRVAGYLHAVGHDVVGVDVDPVLVQAAEADYPGPRWVVADLADLDLAAHGIPQRFDAIVCAGNVLTFCAPSTRRDVLDRFAPVDEAMNTLEFFIHHEDVLRAVDGFAPRVLDPDFEQAVWSALKLNDQAQRTVLCKDPFTAVDDRVQRLIDAM